MQKSKLQLKIKNFILGINTAVHDEVAVFLFDNYKIKKEIARGRKDVLLLLIDRIFRKNKQATKNIRGVAVVSGPGSFTAVRSGVVAANVLGKLLGVPVVGVRGEEFKNEKEFLKIGYERMTKTKKGKIVLPVYGREPNITKPKKWKL